MTWWDGATVYQCYIRSFADGNGDGVGDLIGLRSRLAYLKWLGVDAVWITPFYRSPMVDHGYDVSDPRDADPLFGTLADFDGLVDEAHRLGLRVLIDVIPNHTSDRHPWFQAALAAPVGAPERDRYIWRDPAPDGGPPNNWRSVFGGPAWTLDERSGQFWLHLFAPEQPDLNWRNPEVAADAEATLRFWLDRGVDGFRIDVAHGLFKDARLRDNPEWTGEGVKELWGMEQRHSFDQPEVHDVYRRWRRLVESYGEDRVLLGEVFLWDPARVAAYVREDELHLAFSFMLLGQRWEADNLRRAIEWSAQNSAWALSNHDLPRHATRFGGVVERARAAALLLLGLPGTAVLYQGEELGLEDAEVPEEARQDPIWFRSGGTVTGRDPSRVPLPWAVSRPPAFGFCPDGVSPWLPMPADWGERSVEAQQDDGASILSLYRRALVLRPTLSGPLEWLDSSAAPFAYRRGEVDVLVNVGDAPVPLPAGDVILWSASTPLGLRSTRVLPPDSAVWLHPR
ncbi:MAG: alpha-glucosidase [Acidimicrobiaceae bacterium]|nr:alpha-glucosidase [Acidimicrobiaceae bacterium]